MFPTRFLVTFLAAFLLSCFELSAADQQHIVSSLHSEEFKKYLVDFNFTFSGPDYRYRLQVFSENYDFIENHNKKIDETTVYGITQFTHLTAKEFKDYVLSGGLRVPEIMPVLTLDEEDFQISASAIPSSVNWVTAGAVTSVMNQGACGSCWAFSAVGALEGAYVIAKKGSLTKFSEQQLVSCDTYDYGCNGGWMGSAFRYVQVNRGLPTSRNYPYTSGTTGSSQTCKSGIALVSAVTPKSVTNVPSNSVDALTNAVVLQPVSIAISAAEGVFQFYKAGTIAQDCGTEINHGVLLVGYGTDTNGVPYWQVKNSWGTSWGMSGYVRIARSSANVCRVLDYPSYPSV